MKPRPPRTDPGANAALPDLRPPAHVTIAPEAGPYWLAIIRSRPREEWREVDLVVAAQLAECQALIEHESAVLRVEGSITTSAKGRRVANPRNKVVQTLATREMALMRTLLLGGAASGPDRRDLQQARRLEASARALCQEIDADNAGLLA
jgi:hypothetical protein